MPQGFQAVSVTFVSDQQGWVLGSAACASAPCTSILRTSDGGTSWKAIPAPRASLDLGADVAGSVSQLRFADTLDGYADGDGLWETHNGGASWTQQTTVAGIRNAVVSDLVISQANVYALVAGSEAGSGGSDSHPRLAMASATSGVFRVIADLGASQDAAGLVASGGVVYFISGPIGGTSQLVRVQANMLIHTSMAPSCGLVSASTASALLVVCGQGVAAGSMGAREVYGSSDSGRTFQRLPDPGRGAGFDTDVAADAGGGHAVIGTAGAVSGVLLSTTDFAHSWQAALQVPNAIFSDLGFEDSTHGVVIVTTPAPDAKSAIGLLYRTTDAGASWTDMTFR